MGIAYNRENGGMLVREAWVRWAEQQPNAKPSWLVPWHELSEQDKEADRCIWDEVAGPYVATIRKLVEENEQLRKYVDRLQDLAIEAMPDL